MILWLNPFSGISGDMLLGALLDLGAPMGEVRAAIASTGITGWTLTTEPVERAGLVARQAQVRVDDRVPERRAAAPALILVGSMMLATITEIRWHEPLVAVPAFLTLILIPLTYSIANGLGFGIIAWAVLHLATGNYRKQDWLLYILAVLFLLRFVYLGAS